MSDTTWLYSKCSIDGCTSVQGFVVSLGRQEASRMESRFLAAAGWTSMDGKLACRSCTAMLKLCIGRMGAREAQLVRSALADALWYQRMEVVGVS